VNEAFSRANKSATEQGRKKPPAEIRGLWLRNSGVIYFNDVETVEKVVFKLVPRAWTVAMIATAMPAAMRPYSMAVAPVSSARKRITSVVMMGSSVLTMSLYVARVVADLTPSIELSSKTVMEKRGQ
jgi:hypothetical protein